jgi:hypothetical protein
VPEDTSFRDAISAKVRGDDIRQPDAPRWADVWAAERGQKSDTAWDEYLALGVIAASVGVGVFFACDHWHDSWSKLSLAELALKGPEPLAAQYPWLSGLIAALIALFVGRMLIFFHRLESR